jgi:hypothetical protein
MMGVLSPERKLGSRARHLALALTMLQAMRGLASFDETPAYTAALAAYVEDKLIGSTELERIITACDRGAILNPLLPDEVELDTAKWHAYETLQEWIKCGDLDAAQVCTWAKKTRDAVESQRGQRRRTQRDTSAAWSDDQSSIGVGKSAACGVREDGVLVCWNRGYEFYSPTDFGLVRTISVFGDSVCAVNDNGELRCFDIVSDGNCKAGLTDEERIVCTLADSELNRDVPKHSLGRVRSVVMSPLQTCATTEELVLVCWAHAGSSVDEHAAKVPTDIKNVHWFDVIVVGDGSKMVVLVMANHEDRFRAFCSLGEFPKEEVFEPIIVSHDGMNTCWIEVGNNLSCKEEHSSMAKPSRLEKASFIVADAFSTDLNKGMCAISMEGQVICWSHEREVLGHEGPAVRVAIRDGNACALLKNGSVSCWNLIDTKTQPHQFEPPKNLKLFVPR